MSEYKLYYFSAKGLGEGPRMLFAYGGQEYENITIPSAEWPEYKKKTVFGQMPNLSIDGKVYAQSIAISRYLGNKFGLGGDNLEENLEIDQVVDFIYDIKAKAAQVFYEKDSELKAKRHEEFSQNVYPDMLNYLHDIVLGNKGYVALGKLTWGDFILTGMFDYLKAILQMPDLQENYPQFQKVIDNVTSIPKVKKYLESAPEKEFKF